MDRSEQNLTVRPIRQDPWRWLLLLILAGSAGLRALLVWRGGQFFWADESRYYAASEALERLGTQGYAGFFQRLLDGADHLFFKVLCLAPAGVLHGTGAGPQWFIPGIFCAAFSVVNIFLVWRLARAAGAEPREACLAALLQACANSHFYYGRHLLPYDAALTFGLLALLAGWTGTGWRRSLACGVLAALGFLTYNGYWLFGAVVLTGHVLQAAPDWRRAAGRAGWAAAGLVLPILLLVILARALAGTDLVDSFLTFSRSINQGDFGRGWKLMLDYFWGAERMNFILGLGGLGVVAGGALLARRWHYGMRWVAGVLALAGGLVGCSDVVHQFVIYGRTARQVVPLACLAGAFALERLWRTGGAAGRLATAVIILVLAQAAVNFAGPLQQVFPREFTQRATRLTHELQARGEHRQLVMLYTDHLLGKQGIFNTLPDHDILLAADNPMQYVPYLTEGMTEEQREFFGQTDIRMKLIAVNEARFNHPSALRQPHPGVVRLTLRLPPNKPGVHEPLLVTGATGVGDLIYFIYDYPSGIRLGFDHWGVGGILSAPVEVDYAKPVIITLSSGALHPPQPVAAEVAPAPDPRRWLYVEVNGKVVWSQPAEFHPAPPATIAFGLNYIGGSTCDTKFTGKIIKVESLLLPPDMAPVPAGP